MEGIYAMLMKVPLVMMLLKLGVICGLDETCKLDQRVEIHGGMSLVTKVMATRSCLDNLASQQATKKLCRLTGILACRSNLSLAFSLMP